MVMRDVIASLADHVLAQIALLDNIATSSGFERRQWDDCALFRRFFEDSSLPRRSLRDLYYRVERETVRSTERPPHDVPGGSGPNEKREKHKAGEFRMARLAQRLAVGLVALLLAAGAQADVVVDYVIDAGGKNTYGTEGLSARGTFSITDDTLTILLENTSTSAPFGFEVSDSLLVSLGFDLGDAYIVSGDSAVVGPGSSGLGAWESFTAGTSVAEEWLWTNDGGGDQLHAFQQVISTSMGTGGPERTDFNGDRAKVNGPFGGIAALEPVIEVPKRQRAVSNSIMFQITLNETISVADLRDIALGSVVEFGSDWQYMSAIPSPGALALLAVAGLCVRRRRPRE